jgi:hypothetical protein
MDSTTHPPGVARLHLHFQGWLGDDLIECFPCFAVTEKLGRRLDVAGLSGFTLASLEVSTSVDFDELHGQPLPPFLWLQILAPSDEGADFRTTDDHRLEVSDRALAVLREGNLEHAEIQSSTSPARPIGTTAEQSSITITMGNEYAPDDPWGAEEIRLRRDGQITYANRHRGKQVSRRGRIDETRTAAIFDHLVSSTFPKIPEHLFPPGASIVGLRLERGDVRDDVRFDSFFALRLPGYGDLVRDFQSLAAALRKNDATALAEWGFEPEMS